MTLEEFLKSQEEDIKHFRSFWLEQSRGPGARFFPLSMPYEEWKEQFAATIDLINNGPQT